MSLFLYEHKTTSDDISPGSPWWRRVISIDPQVTIYLNGLQASGLDCRGVVYDALRKPAHRPSSKGETAEHYHPRSEEMYYFVAGAGRMRLGDEEDEIGKGDCVVIPPGTPHKLFNPGPEPLVLLCCCAPPYADGDTVMTGR